MTEGIHILTGLDIHTEEFHRLINLPKLIKHCVVTVINVKKFYQLKLQLLSASDKKTMTGIARQIEALALYEIENAKESIPLVDADSRLGWEPRMEYLGDAGHIKWKIRQVNYMLEYELKKYREV